MNKMDDCEKYQARFIMNALKDGWTVAMIKDHFKFTKKRKDGPEDSEYEKEGYSLDFVKKYGQVR
jgi:hypothetical protein